MIFRKESADNNFKPEIPPRKMDEALESLNKSPRGTHCLVVYPDLITLRTMYTHYTKIQLEKNEIVLILPYYETTDMVRLFLSGINVYGDNNDNNPFGYSGIQVGKYEKEGSLMIMDSLKAYFPSEEQGSFDYKNTQWGLNLKSFIDILLKHAKRRRKDGVTVLSDLGSFYHNSHNHSNQKLIEYEKSIPKKYEDMSLKGFCLYHQNDFERHFSQERQSQLLECHNRNIVLTS
jgi:hypothetical protein